MDVDFVFWPHNPNFVRRMAEAGRKRWGLFHEQPDTAEQDEPTHKPTEHLRIESPDHLVAEPRADDHERQADSDQRDARTFVKSEARISRNSRGPAEQNDGTHGSRKISLSSRKALK